MIVASSAKQHSNPLKEEAEDTTRSVLVTESTTAVLISQTRLTAIRGDDRAGRTFPV